MNHDIGHHGMDIVVIGGGWSVGQYDMKALCTRLNRSVSIGVNDAALLVPDCDYALSMDRLWTEGRWPQVQDLFAHDQVYIRKGVVKNFVLPPGVNQFEHINDGFTLASEPDKLNGSNSGTCAINLAWQWARRDNFAKVFLLGFDMQSGPNGEHHWYPNYPWRPNGATKKGNFNQWAREFWAINEKFKTFGITLINVNHRSAIKDLPTITFEEFVER